jgi:myo-inositol-1(or 4)-monophosphatase
VLSNAELDECAALIDELARRAVERILSERPRADQIATKTSLADWVTETDLGVERLVRAEIRARFPGHRVVGEEYGTSGPDAHEATWYVDPVDGTTNFVHALPWSSFSLCVADEVGPAASVVADPYRRELISAVRGRGARHNGKPVACSTADSLMGGIVLTEMLSQSLWPATTELMASLAAEGCVTRIMGSNALSIASAGIGRATAVVIGSFGAGDCLGAALIASEAGAIVLARSSPPADGEPLVCVAPGAEADLRRIWPERLAGPLPARAVS